LEWLYPIAIEAAWTRMSGEISLMSVDLYEPIEIYMKWPTDLSKNVQQAVPIHVLQIIANALRIIFCRRKAP
jgi:hypothetical protein